MAKVILRFCVSFLLFSSYLVAGEYRVLQVDQNSELVAFGTDKNQIESISLGQTLKLKFSDETKCEVKISKVVLDKNRFFARLQDCPNKTNLKKDILLNDGTKDSFALDDDNQEKETESREGSSGLPTINESWYTYWGLGLAFIKYPSEVQSSLDSLEALGFDRFKMSMDLFGFYWPIMNHTAMLGFIVNAVSDSYTYDQYGVSAEVSIRQYLYGVSMMKFFGANIGNGFFLRGDAGIARYQAELKATTTSITEESDSGFGLLLGGGYAVPFGKETRLLFNLNHAYRKAEDTEIYTTTLTAGFLF